MPMKCHYEVLNVQRDASADDLKKGYRKLALKWHPDKNPDQIEECTQQFRLVQQAYEVLNDPQERAFYDKHREAILRGGLGQGDQYEDNCLNVFQYFNSSGFKGYGDDKEGFYAVYDEVFRLIAEEDRQFLEDDEQDDFHVLDFGNSSSVYEEVVKLFYDYWESYCTAKSYVWKEKYDLREAPDRRVRRLMEAENKKLRDAAKQERNSEVRALVKYVKKRDKRVQEYKKRLEERAEEIKRKAQEQRKRHIEEGRREVENFKEAEWSSATGLEHHYQELEAKYAKQFGDHESGSGEDAEEEVYYDDLYCVACDRAFKNDKSYKNHEKSKKHKEFVAILKAHMAEEAELELDGEGGGAPGDHDDDLTNERQEPEEEATSQKLSKKQKKKRKQQRNAAMTEPDDVTDVTDDLQSTNINPDDTPKPVQKGKSKRDKRREKKNKFLLEDDSDEEENEANELSESVDTKLSSDQTNEACTRESLLNETHENETALGKDTTTAGDECILERLSNGNRSDSDNETESSVHGTQQESSQGNDGAADNVVKNDVDGSSTRTKKKKGNNKSQPDPNQKMGRCGVCGAEFSSRSRLFEHIKKEGHAMLKSEPPVDPSATKQGKKNKKKKGK